MTTGHRYGGPEAFDAGIVDQTADAGDLRDTAVTGPLPWRPTATPAGR